MSESFDPDEAMLRTTAESPLVGAERIIWASDYPHGDSTWPNSRKALAESPLALHGPDLLRKRAVTRLTLAAMIASAMLAPLILGTTFLALTSTNWDSGPVGITVEMLCAAVLRCASQRSWRRRSSSIPSAWIGGSSRRNCVSSSPQRSPHSSSPPNPARCRRCGRVPFPGGPGRSSSTTSRSWGW